MEVRISDSAEQDLTETLAYYRAPSAMGDALNALLANTIKHLTRWPYTGHRRRDLVRQDVCFWYDDPYLFVFEIKNDVLSIVAVLHRSRNTSRILRTRLRKLKIRP